LGMGEASVRSTSGLRLLRAPVGLGEPARDEHL
jgi:hypothetical protein